MKNMKVTATVNPTAISDYTSIPEGIVKILLDEYAGDFINLDEMSELYDYVDITDAFDAIYGIDLELWKYYSTKYDNDEFTFYDFVNLARDAGFRAYPYRDCVVYIK